MKQVVRSLAFAAVLGLASCTGLSDAPLSPSVAKRMTAQLDETLGKEVSFLDEQIRAVRQELVMLVMTQMLEVETANQAQSEFMVADYFMARSWASVVEQNPNAKLLLKEGQAALKRGVDIVLKAVDAERERRSF